MSAAITAAEQIADLINAISDSGNAQTKYLVGKVWARHLHYTHNFDGEPPPVAAKATKKVKPAEGE